MSSTAPSVSPRPAGRSRGRPVSGEATLSWRVIRDGAVGGARNMALDHALALSVGERGGAVLRLYRWSEPTVSFGRNEVAVGRYSVRDADRERFAFVRRPTGGRAVLHADELTYAVVVPVGTFGGPRALYRRVNEALAGALRALGADVGVAPEGEALGLDAGPCFRSPVRGEVVGRGAKVVGSAQARIGGALLQHGSILISGDQRGLAALSGDEAEVGRVTTLEELVGPVDRDRLAAEVTRGLNETLEGRWSEGEYSDSELFRADGLISDRYGRHGWTWRR